MVIELQRASACHWEHVTVIYDLDLTSGLEWDGIRDDIMES